MKKGLMACFAALLTFGMVACGETAPAKEKCTAGGGRFVTHQLYYGAFGQCRPVRICAATVAFDGTKNGTFSVCAPLYGRGGGKFVFVGVGHDARCHFAQP